MTLGAPYLRHRPVFSALALFRLGPQSGTRARVCSGRQQAATGAQAHSRLPEHDPQRPAAPWAPAMPCIAKSSAKRWRHFEALLLDGACSTPCQPSATGTTPLPFTLSWERSAHSLQESPAAASCLVTGSAQHRLHGNLGWFMPTIPHPDLNLQGPCPPHTLPCHWSQ